MAREFGWKDLGIGLLSMKAPAIAKGYYGALDQQYAEEQAQKRGLLAGDLYGQRGVDFSQTDTALPEGGQRTVIQEPQQGQGYLNQVDPGSAEEKYARFNKGLLESGDPMLQEQALANNRQMQMLGMREERGPAPKYSKTWQGDFGQTFGLNQQGEVEKVAGAITGKRAPKALVENYINNGQGVANRTPMNTDQKDVWGIPHAVTSYYDDKGVPKIMKTSATTEAQTKAGAFSDRMQQAAQENERLKEGGFDATDSANLIGRFISEYGGMAGNQFIPSEQQQYMQLMNNWGSAVLRDESGAVLAEDEMRKELKKYWPQPGDSRETVAQKLRTRNVAETNMSNRARGTINVPGAHSSSRKGRNKTKSREAPLDKYDAMSDEELLNAWTAKQGGE